jgi:hypothetical protein
MSAFCVCDRGHLEEDLSPRVRNGSRLAELWDSVRKEGWDIMTNETNVYAYFCFERVIYSAHGGCGGSGSVGWPL